MPTAWTAEHVLALAPDAFPSLPAVALSRGDVGAWAQRALGAVP